MDSTKRQSRICIQVREEHLPLPNNSETWKSKVFVAYQSMQGKYKTYILQICSVLPYHDTKVSVRKKLINTVLSLTNELLKMKMLVKQQKWVWTILSNVSKHTSFVFHCARFTYAVYKYFPKYSCGSFSQPGLTLIKTLMSNLIRHFTAYMITYLCWD